MAQLPSKRNRSDKDNPQRSKKRRKVEAPKTVVRNPVAVDDLSWSQVEVTDPDLLGDGSDFMFLDLEEIDGVDISRPDGTGKVVFETVSEQPPKKPNKKSPSSTATKAGDVTAQKGEDDEWSGIEDSDAEAAAPSILISKHPSEGGEGDLGLQDGVPYTVLNGDYIEDVESADVSRWKALSLSPDTLTGIAGLGFSGPTPIQTACIPEILAGKDVIGKASTGSGKTLAFGIPILEYYLSTEGPGGTSKKGAEAKSKDPIALILSPTRELAQQLTRHISELTRPLAETPRIASVIGGLSVQKQRRLLADADIVIGTPGRLWDVVSNDTGLISRLKKIHFLVIDEADRLLSQGHFSEVEEILAALEKQDTTMGEADNKATNQERQTLVFSATFHKDLQQKLARGKHKTGDDMNNKKSLQYLIQKLPFQQGSTPKFIDVNPVHKLPEGLKEGLLQCDAMERDLYLYSLLILSPNARILVFANAISAVRRLTKLFQELELNTSMLYHGMPQKARLRAIERFSVPRSENDKGAILIATDALERGIDIPGVDIVVHYHVPDKADTYIHRSGRTARAEETGKSILICTPAEVPRIKGIVSQVHDGSGKSKPLQPMILNHRILNGAKQRLKIANEITNATIAKEKTNTKDNWLRTAADELGVDYESEEFANEGRKMGRGRTGREKREKETARSLTKADLSGLKAQLKEMLAKRINMGVSPRYLAGGAVDMEAVLRGDTQFLGHLAGVDL